MFFSSYDNGNRVSAVGEMADDGSDPQPDFASLMNGSFHDQAFIRGGLYVDQTGIFTNYLIAVTYDGGVWDLGCGKTNLLVHIPSNPELEGVITLPAGSQYGPWAGKIVSGSEDNPHLIYTIDPTGNYTSSPLIYHDGNDYVFNTEDFDIIPPNQDLYVTDRQGERILKIEGQ